MKKCIKCGVELIEGKNWYPIHKKNRLYYCNDCHLKWKRDNYRLNPKRREYTLKHNKEYKIKCKMIVHIHYGGDPPRCACCGETILEFLTIDHIHGGGYQQRKITGAGIGFYRWLIKNNFPEGYQILCYNCNMAKGHFGYCPHQL